MPFNSTPKLLPAPLGTDRVMDGDDAMRRLAQAVDNMAQAGLASVTFATANVQVNTAVTFPVAFAANPAIVLTPAAVNAPGFDFSVTNVSPTGFTLVAQRNATGTVSFHWHAIGNVVALP